MDDGAIKRARPAPGGPTQLALQVDRDAIGLMKHVSEIGHLIEWWLQGAQSSMDAFAAFRIGRRLERLRLAARLADGRASRQVQASLESLRSELASHRVPGELLIQLDAADKESERLRSSTMGAPTLVRRALSDEEPWAAPMAAPASESSSWNSPEHAASSVTKHVKRSRRSSLIVLVPLLAVLCIWYLVDQGLIAIPLRFGF